MVHLKQVKGPCKVLEHVCTCGNTLTIKFRKEGNGTEIISVENGNQAGDMIYCYKCRAEYEMEDD